MADLSQYFPYRALVSRTRSGVAAQQRSGVVGIVFGGFCMR